jgi:hypothetical protein
MVNKLEVAGTDLEKTIKENLDINIFSVAKHVYMDKGEVDTIGFALIRES